MNSVGTRAVAGPSRTVVVSALGVSQILGWGSSFYLPAVLAKPIADETGWSLAWIVGAVSVGMLTSGLVAPRVGRTIDLRGGRSVLACGALLLAAGQAVLAVAPSLPVYAGAWVILGLGMACGLYDAAFSTLGRLYGSAARRAITALTLWGGLASTVCWPLSAWLVELVGWRGTCCAYAVLHLAVVLPLHLFTVPRIQDSSVAADEKKPQTPPGAPSEGMLSANSRASALVLLTIVFTIGGMILSVWSVHLLTVLQGIGFSLAAAVTLGALVGPAQVGSRIVEMLAARYNHHPIWTQVASSILVAAGLIALALGIPILAPALIVYGAGSGLLSVARGTVPLALFGPKGYAALMGKMAMPGLVAGAAAPTLGAVLLEHVGPRGLLMALALLAAFNLLLIAILLMRVRSAKAGE